MKTLDFKGYYLKPNQKAKSLIKWKYHDSQIEGKNGEIYFSLKNIKAPESWSPLAIDIAASKYFRKTVKKENSIEALIERLGSGLLSAAMQSKLFKDKKTAEHFVEELKYILYTQKAAFNSPVWFNLGLKESYQLKSKSTHYAWDNKKNKIVQIDDAYKNPQVSACFIQSVEDNLESIFDLVQSEAKLFKYGSGSGTNFSNLRGKNELLSSGGTSSGLISFLDVLDKAAGAIKSGGTTRRAAKMVCVDIDHPEIEDFISWKLKEEKKAKSLIAEGYSADLDGEAYKTISGQNANNSVRISDKFMKAMQNKQNWKLINRGNKKVYKILPAEDLWNQICKAAWGCADPGLQFSDTINKYHTCAATDKINASNPCSEYMFLDDSACNLASLNLAKFLNQNGEFNVEEFCYVARLVFIAQECLVDFASYPTEKIALNSHMFRPLGLGYANLGSLFMKQALAYDSDEARAWAGFLTSMLTGVAYETSAEMAKCLGAFKGLKENKKSFLSVLQKHQKSLKQIDWSKLSAENKKMAESYWNQTLVNFKKYGIRNAQATVIAPTGTIGLVMDCDTTGIEPDFSLVKFKKLSGGGYLKIVNKSVSDALIKLGYLESEIIKINEQLEATGSLLRSDIKSEHRKLFSCATGDLALSPDAHLKMMAAVQPFVSGAISKTVNLPAESTVKDISETYLKAWKLGLKAVALYRDGSKFVQPLSSRDSEKKNEYPNCTECGHETTLESGCYRCTNCGTTTACAS